MSKAGMAVRVREASPEEIEHWDARVRSFDGYRVVHTRAWIESLRDVGVGTPLYLLFEKDAEIVGCWPGLLTIVGGFRLFGSPLAGWQTVSMGPVFDPARITTAELMHTGLAWLQAEHNVTYVELLHESLDGDAMRAQGFEGRPVCTYRAQLVPGQPGRLLKTFKDSARRNVRRAQRLGLEAKFEDEERFVDVHYEQLRQVYQRNGTAIPFSRERVLACFRRMRASGNLLAASVYLPGGRVNIATGMFFLDGRELLLWTWAHNPYYRWYRPTELMTWMVMCRAVEAGCETFDFMGRGDFKAKFGAVPDTTKWRWLWARPGWLIHARDFAGAGYRLQQAVRGRAARLVARVAEPRAHGNGARRPTACVLGDIDLVQALGLAGVEAVVVAPPGTPSRFSRYTRTALDWMDPWERPAELVEELLAFSAAQPEPPVLFYQEDRSLLLASRYRQQLSQAFRFVLADAWLIEQLVDKSAFQRLATELGLPVPPARVLDPSDAALPDDLEFPLILKPLIRRPDRWEAIAGPGKALQVESAEALRTVWPSLASGGMRVLAQTLIPGPETCIESYHCYVDEPGETVAEFTGRKIRTYPANYGDSTALEITDAPDVERAGREAVARLGLKGVAKFDFKRGPDGTLYLLEVNPRFTLWHHPGARAGVNIPALVYDDLIGRPRRSVPRARAGVRWCKVWTDRAAARSHGVSLLRWMRWVAGCEAKSALAWGDPVPLMGASLERWLTRSPRAAARVTAPPTPSTVAPNR